ncbi:MAG: hypothetical protein JWQ42_3653 [Edaphobacter sp.]|nr:hypothetical protein [Edaphobacter sp.]
MELFLNSVWLSVSVFLVILCLRSFRNGHTKLTWSTVIALCLLLVLLFPVISMTDDLVAMTTPADAEHMFRRYDASWMQNHSLWLLDAFALLSLIVAGIASLLSCSTRFSPNTFVATLLAGLVRALGVRPPPAASPIAA